VGQTIGRQLKTHYWTF